MRHPLPTHPRFGNLHTATVADNTPVFDAFVFTAVAFPVFGRTKNTLTEETITLRLECAVIDSLRFLHFAVRSGENLIRRGQLYGDGGKLLSLFVFQIEHASDQWEHPLKY
jgi:hypothetical protein